MHTISRLFSFTSSIHSDSVSNLLFFFPFLTQKHSDTVANPNAMATTVDSSTDHRSPHTNTSQNFDLYGFSQTDLYNLSLSSDSAPHRRREASVIPKIDRSVFNESAGSRRQTYARLRLLPRNKQPPASASAKAVRIPLRTREPVDEENSQIISLLQGLFGVESIRNANANRQGGGSDEDGLVPVPVEFKHLLPESPAVEFQSIPIDVVDTGQRKRKRGRPRKNENYAIVIKEEEPKKVDVAAIPPPPQPPPPPPVIVNGKGFAVDVVGLGEVGDPFGEEVKRRTQGLETQEQLLEFLEGLNGEWGSQRKKRRIVPASDLGDLLPAGWKIVLSLQRRAGRASVICRRYVSPDGHQFESCKEVSTYLLSFFGVQDISHLKSNYTDGRQHFSSTKDTASGAGWFPTADMKTDANLDLASIPIDTLHEKQAIASSSIEREKLNSSDGNFNNDLNLDCKSGETTGSAFRGFEHQTEDKCLPLKTDKNDANSVMGCPVDEDRVRNVRNEKLVGAIEASNGASNLYIPLDFAPPFSNNNSGICQFSDEVSDVTSIKSDMSNFASQDRNIGCYENFSCENEQAHVDSHRHGLSVRLVEDHGQKIGFESSLLAPNPERKILAVNNLEDRHLISSLEDMEISDGKPIKDDVSTRYQSEDKDISTIVKPHLSINSTDKTQTSMLKDSAEGKCFDIDLPSPFIDDITCVHSGYINNVSDSTCPHNASEAAGVVVSPDFRVAEDVLTNYVQERSSSTDQNCKMDCLLHNNEHPSAFDNNMSNISAGTVDALKAVDAGCKKAQLGIVSCSDAVDAYACASTMQGRSRGCMSAPLAGSILNQFDEQSNDGVNNANKSCSPEKAKSEAEMFQTDSIDMPTLISCQIDSDADMVTNAVHETMYK